MSVSSESSAEIRWSIVGMLQPGAILICWPDLIVIGESVLVFGADLVRGDGANGVHEPGVVPEAVDLLSGGGNPELAIVLEEC